MIDDPGCTAGMEISPNPVRGPETSSRMSLQMLDTSIAAVRIPLEMRTNGPIDWMAAKRLRQVERREAHRGRRGVVRGLAHVHVVVGVHVLVRPETATEDLVGAVGQNLVDVHVERDARAGMEDVDDELVDVLPGED